MTRTLASVTADLRQRLAAAGIADAALDARLLVTGILGLAPSAPLLTPDLVLETDHLAAVEAAARRRLAHEPVHRILGRRDFYGLTLDLSPETLEPRPDTEVLVDSVLPFLAARVAEAGCARVLDLGTGTGAILLALLAEVPAATGLAVDISADALSTASSNAERLGLSDRFQSRISDWFATVDGQFDLIVSNPPYIEAAVVDRLAPEVRLHDPRRALDGGADGLDAYRQIAAGAADFLVVDGQVAVEIGFDQRLAVTGLFQAEGFRLLAGHKDLAGQDRVVVFKR